VQRRPGADLGACPAKILFNLKGVDAMNKIKLIALLLVSGLWFAPAAHCADALSDIETRMIGIWEAYEPSPSVVQLFPDHTIKIYLTEQQGRAKNLHYYEGRWRISGDMILTLSREVNGKEISMPGKVSFKDGEMWILPEASPPTKNRKISALPEKYKW
jgi:hypothetical protein